MFIRARYSSKYNYLIIDFFYHKLFKVSEMNWFWLNLLPRTLKYIEYPKVI